ncbi:MAG: GNAT family N-acetyltransferase, partial [Actinomycetota bacterium]
MTIEVRRVGTPADDPAGFAAVVDLMRADGKVRDPGDPPMPGRQLEADLFAPHPRKQRFVWLAEAAGEPAALVWAETESDVDDDLQLVSLEVIVDPTHRRRGLATALVDEALPTLSAAGQNSVCGYPCHDIDYDAAVALCHRYGLTRRSEERCSRVTMDDIDESMMDEWTAQAAVSAPGYRLEQWEGACPDHLAAAWQQAEAGMDDAPLDDFDYHRVDLDAEAQRQEDAAAAAGGYRIHRSLVLGPEGDAAGMSAIYVHEDRPEIGYQDDTAVLADHRGRRLGRWLKAANYRLTRQAHPELRVIETYNAQSNPWMLDINVAMGFRPHHVYDLWPKAHGHVDVEHPRVALG